MCTLFVLDGSLHSRYAKDLLDENAIAHEYIQVADRPLFLGLFRDYGIRQLPALTLGTERYEGLEEIRHFVETHRGEQPAL